MSQHFFYLYFMFKKSFFFLFILLITACGSNQNDRLIIDSEKLPQLKIKIDNYGEKLFKIASNDFESGIIKLSKEYPLFLGGIDADPANLKQIRSFIYDPFLAELNEITQAKYADLVSLEEALSDAFKHYKYYFPQAQIPSIYSYISGLQFEQSIMYSGDAMIIGLDLYLGDSYDYTQMGLPQYKISRMDQQFIVPDCMHELALQHIPFVAQKDMLSEMIQNGKVLYFKEAMLPTHEKHLLIGFTPEQLQWSVQNESNIWRMFIDQELLFSGDYEKIRKFVTDGPFTQSISREAPANLGSWIGWKIIKSYMNKNPELSLEDLFYEKDAQKILKESGYKPGK